MSDHQTKAMEFASMHTNLKKSDRRKDDILRAALLLATPVGGWQALSRKAVADQAGCSEALVSAHFGTMVQFRRAVMRKAIAAGELTVIGQGIAAGDSIAVKIDDPDLRAKALDSLKG